MHQQHAICAKRSLSCPLEPAIQDADLVATSTTAVQSAVVPSPLTWRERSTALTLHTKVMRCCTKHSAVDARRSDANLYCDGGILTKGEMVIIIHSMRTACSVSLAAIIQRVGIVRLHKHDTSFRIEYSAVT